MQPLKLFKIALWGRKEAYLTFMEFSQWLNIIRNYEKFICINIARVKVVPARLRKNTDFWGRARKDWPPPNCLSSSCQGPDVDSSEDK
jgi:hypothetical protein